MFRCGKCKQLSKPGEKQQRVVTEIRSRIYHGERKRDRKEREPAAGFGEPFVVGHGTEIVTEAAYCSPCAKPAVEVASA